MTHSGGRLYLSTGHLATLIRQDAVALAMAAGGSSTPTEREMMERWRAATGRPVSPVADGDPPLPSPIAERDSNQACLKPGEQQPAGPSADPPAVGDQAGLTQEVAGQALNGEGTTTPAVLLAILSLLSSR